jgi:hypothetical protein
MDMNTIGKILVILNFVFALVVGGFLVIDLATRTNWKTAYDNLKREMDVLKASRESSNIVLQQQVNASKAVFNENDELKRKIVDTEALAKVNEDELTRKIADYELKLKGSDQTLQKSLAEQERLKTELVDRNNTLKEREKTVVDTEAERNKYRAEAIAQEQRSKALQDRNEQLVDELQRKALDLARLQEGGAGKTAASPLIRSTAQENPPAAKVRGKVEKVDATEPSLVQLSLGTDQGVNQNNTLYAYRLSPRVEYLGIIRVVEAHPHHSVGRLVNLPGGIRHALREGDVVSSYLGN